MADWKEQLAGLGSDLQARERAVDEKKASVLNGFRKLLVQLEPVAKAAAEFGDAFGVDCTWEISRFDNRYPYLRFRIIKPALAYEVLCRGGVLEERLQEAGGPVRTSAATLEALVPRRFEQRVTGWVQAAANANRKVPGRKG